MAHPINNAVNIRERRKSGERRTVESLFTDSHPRGWFSRNLMRDAKNQQPRRQTTDGPERQHFNI
jgi:hypothetical protein